jgi:hypothetical protein
MSAMRALAGVAALGCSLALSSTANAEPNRRGLQIEGMVGGAACLPGRAPCRQENDILDGRTRPSFGIGGAIGIRPVKWFMIGALYRWGMFHPGYSTEDGVDYKWGGQHTVALMLRPIIPIWRFDLGLNIAPGFGRQVFRRDQGRDRDYSQGFAFLVGPVLDIFVTDNFFLGAEVDFVLNTQSKVCQRRGEDVTCIRKPDGPMLTPTHQVLFGLHLGGTFL